MSLKPKKSFIERWEITREIGKRKYCLRWTLLWALFIVLGNVISLLIFQKFPDWIAICVNIFALVILWLLSLLSWSSSEREYALLKEQKASQPEQNSEEPNNTEISKKADYDGAVILDEIPNDNTNINRDESICDANRSESTIGNINDNKTD